MLIDKRGQFEPIPRAVEALASQTVDSAFRVHKELGPGLLESVYEVCLCHELATRGIHFERQRDWPITYANLRLDAGLRLDLLVDNQVIVELKAIDQLAPVHDAQVLTISN
jgi:GxxExxY protein